MRKNSKIEIENKPLNKHGVERKYFLVTPLFKRYHIATGKEQKIIKQRIRCFKWENDGINELKRDGINLKINTNEIYNRWLTKNELNEIFITQFK